MTYSKIQRDRTKTHDSRYPRFLPCTRLLPCTHLVTHDSCHARFLSSTIGFLPRLVFASYDRPTYQTDGNVHAKRFRMPVGFPRQGQSFHNKTCVSAFDRPDCACLCFRACALEIASCAPRTWKAKCRNSKPANTLLHQLCLRQCQVSAQAISATMRQPTCALRHQLPQTPNTLSASQMELDICQAQTTQRQLATATTRSMQRAKRQWNQKYKAMLPKSMCCSAAVRREQACQRCRLRNTSHAAASPKASMPERPYGKTQDATKTQATLSRIASHRAGAMPKTSIRKKTQGATLHIFLAHMSCFR